MAEWVGADRLAALTINGEQLRNLGMQKWPGTPQGINRRAKISGWEGRKVGSSQRWEYCLSSLPRPVQQAVASALVKVTPAQVPAQLDLPLPDVSGLKTYQRTPMEARAALLAHIDQMMISGVSQGKAVMAMVEAAASESLPPELQRLVGIANVRAGEGRSLSRPTIYNWLAARKKAAGEVVALAPKAVLESPIPDWASTFIDLYCVPSQPGMAECLDYWPAGVDKPSYDQVRRFMKRVDAVTRNTGRMGPKALQQLKAHTKRDVSDLWPGAVFIGDGHTCKWEVAHPLHGQPFRPELTAILDVYTRRWVGWSAALAENTWSVADALRHAICSATHCAIFYYDNGSGAKNKVWDDALTGLTGRLSISKQHSAPWSSQARGIIERFNSSVLHRLARQKPSYVGNRMDDEARRRAYKISRKEIKETGTSKIIPGWQDFLDCIDAEMLAYNNRPHSSLPKIIDAETGKLRNMTPNEAWELAIAEGWVPDPIPAEESRDLFRPAERRKTKRALVSLLGNDYYHAALEAYHGDDVVVAYDIHDASKVWVSALDGRFICEAIWDGHKTSYVPVSKAMVIEQNRIDGRVCRLDRHREIAQAERQHVLIDASASSFATMPERITGPMIEIEAPAATAVSAEKMAEASRLIDQMVDQARASENSRPSFGSDVEWAKWLMTHAAEIKAEDRALLRQHLRNSDFRLLLEWAGVEATTLDALANHTTKTEVA